MAGPQAGSLPHSLALSLPLLCSALGVVVDEGKRADKKAENNEERMAEAPSFPPRGGKPGDHKTRESQIDAVLASDWEDAKFLC
jgi:hypothetical protein